VRIVDVETRRNVSLALEDEQVGQTRDGLTHS
jgi:hypothetical protein